MTSKSTPKCDEFEMYNVTGDPIEIYNLFGNAAYSPQQTVLAGLLEQQRAQKRRFPYSGSVPGQPIEVQPVCIAAELEPASPRFGESSKTRQVSSGTIRRAQVNWSKSLCSCRGGFGSDRRCGRWLPAGERRAR